MSDLISRSGLLKAFNNKGIQITFDLPVEEILGEDVDIDDFTMLVQDAIQAYKKMVIDTIKEQPTAYDIDKVIDELEELRKYKERMEMQYLDDITDPLEPLKLQSALQSEILKYEYRKEHKPQDINVLEIMYALKHCLEEQLKERESE